MMQNRARLSNPGRPLQRGALVIEAMLAILISAFALLGFVAMQARATSSEFESYQRSQALVLIEDLSNRMNANRANAADYVTADLIGAGALEDCTGLASAALDLCEWGNLIRGNAETRSGASVGSMIAARGCVTRAVDSTDRYVLSIAWQGMVATAGSGSTCGLGDANFPSENLRRAVSSTVCVGQLRDPAAPPSTPRC